MTITADPWVYVVLGVILSQIVKMFALVINHAVIEHRRKRFLKLVNIKFPDKKNVTFTSVDTSDRRTMAKLERQLREYVEDEEDEVPDRRSDR